MIKDNYFKKIKTSFCFLDETGLIHKEKDKFFAIGIVKTREPEKIYNKIRKIRQRNKYKEEIKWAKLNKKFRFRIARKIFNIFLTENIKFECIILDKNKMDFEGYFDNDLYKAYRSFSIFLLRKIIGKNPKDIFVLLADDYFAPDGVNLEVTIKKFINNHYGKFVIAGVCQIDSKSSDMIQLTDLILGAIVYDLKKHKNLLGRRPNEYKRKFLNYVYQKLDINKSFFDENYFNFSSAKIKRTNGNIPSGKIKINIFNNNKNKNRP